MTTNYVPPVTGRTALVTGGSRGIGRAVTEALLEAGARLAICGRNASAIDETVASLGSDGNLIGKVCDVGDYDQVRDLFAFVKDSFGGVDILVNNAGVGRFGRVDQLSVEQWRETIDTNLSGTFYCCKEAVPQMIERGGGFIVNIVSLAGKHTFAGGAAYNASKFGVNGFTEAIMADLRHEKIRVCQIMPGSVQTDFGGSGVEGADWKLDPHEIARTVVHIVNSPERNLVSRVEMRPSRPAKK